jgi:hypothetical protein
MSNNMNRLPTFTVLALFLACSFACLGPDIGGGDTGGNNPSPGSGGSRTGEYYVDMDEPHVLIATTRSNLHDLHAYCERKNGAGIERMVSKGAVLLVKPKTRVRVTDHGSVTCAVTIDEGEYDGRTGFIASEFVHEKQK